MNRSAINTYIREASAFFAQHGFVLPPFADWAPNEWQQHGTEADEIRLSKLGWDVTDFNSAQFMSIGLTLFTLRNGCKLHEKLSKVYAEKIMYVRQNQVTPFHYHERKTEDIINRGDQNTGRLLVQLYKSTESGDFAQSDVTVSCDGVERQVKAGGTVILGPGESITLTPYLYHMFYAIDGNAIIGEVSSVNDDSADNHFKDPLPRFPQIIEDEPPYRLLCTEY